MQRGRNGDVLFGLESSIGGRVGLKIQFVDVVENDVYIVQGEFVDGVQYVFDVVIGSNVVMVVWEEVYFISDVN